MRLSPLDMGTAFFEEQWLHGTSLQNTGIPGPGSLWMCEGVPVNPLALFFFFQQCAARKSRGCATAALISSQDGTLSGRSAFVESCPNVVTQALERNCYLHSCSCPLFLFSFFFVSLVLVSMLAFLCDSFLPVVPSPDPGGFPPSHVFGQFLHSSKHHCLLTALLPGTWTSHPRNTPGKGFVDRNISGDLIFFFFFFLKSKYQKMFRESTFVIAGGQLCPCSWFPSCCHLIEEPEHDFLEKQALFPIGSIMVLPAK